MDATLVAAPRQRNTAAEKEQIKAGKSASEIWPDEPAKAAQKDVDARWTVKTSRPREADTAKRVLPTLAIPVFGYKSHLSIDRRFGFIRSFAVTDAARHDGALLRELVRTDNTASDVWADTAYRSKANEEPLARNGFVSRIHRKKPPGKPMPKNVASANSAKSKVRAAVEHVFARQKGPMALVVRTIALARASVTIGLAHLVYNMNRIVWLDRTRPRMA